VIGEAQPLELGWREALYLPILLRKVRRTAKTKLSSFESLICYIAEH